jgi:hypothetical protein
MEFAKRLPKTRRVRFLKGTVRNIVTFVSEFARNHQYAIIYGSVGYVIGRVLDSLLVLPLPGLGGLHLTLNLAGLVLGTAALGYGILQDCDAARLRDIVLRQVRRALL